MNSNFCLHPWQGLDISAQKEFKPCCKYRKSLGNSIDEYLKSKELADLRHNFLQGKKDPGCVRCWEDEAAGLPSKRQIDNEYVFKDKGIFRNETNIRVLNIALGNICNLSCRTCSSHSSSKWRSDEIKLQQVNEKFVNKIFLHNSYYKDPKFFDKLFTITGDLIAIDINGGEPFYNDHASHLNFLSELKNKKQIKLKYITNATIKPDENFIKLWDEFGAVEIMISIDGIDLHNDYIRYPSNWSEIYSNIKFYQSFKNIQLSVSHTLSIFNILYLPEFMLWCEKEGLPKPYMGLVNRPFHYNIKNLPEYIKNRIISKFYNYEDIPDLKSVIQHLNQKEDSAEWQKFLDITKNLDTIRKQKIADYLPELCDLIK